MIDLGYLFSEFLSDTGEWHYMWMGFFIGFIIAWIISWIVCAWFIHHGYGLKIKNRLRARKRRYKWGKEL